MVKSTVKALVLSGNNLTDVSLDALLNFVTLNNVLKNVYLPKNYVNILKSKPKINLLKDKGVNIYIWFYIFAICHILYNTIYWKITKTHKYKSRISSAMRVVLITVFLAFDVSHHRAIYLFNFISFGFAEILLLAWISLLMSYTVYCSIWAFILTLIFVSDRS